MENNSDIVEVGPGFWNIRGHFKIFAGIVDIGTHMSLIRLASGNFLVVDTIPLTDPIKAFIDNVTENGTKIEAVLATHPFHTLAFPAFFQAYPNPAYFGTPRHLRVQPQIGWAGNLNDCTTRNKWSPEVEMRIPDGAEFVAPVPEKTNHFSCVFVYHAASRTLHVDDTIMCGNHPGLLLKFAGFKHGTMSFHPTIKNVGLHHTPEAPFQFRDWLRAVINDWDFDNVCTAHMGNKIGGAKAHLSEVLDRAEPLLQKLSEKFKKQQQSGGSGPDDTGEHQLVVSGNECG